MDRLNLYRIAIFDNEAKKKTMNSSNQGLKITLHLEGITELAQALWLAPFIKTPPLTTLSMGLIFAI
jgi:hypothetical protein